MLVNALNVVNKWDLIVKPYQPQNLNARVSSKYLKYKYEDLHCIGSRIKSSGVITGVVNVINLHFEQCIYSSVFNSKPLLLEKFARTIPSLTSLYYIGNI